MYGYFEVAIIGDRFVSMITASASTWMSLFDVVLHLHCRMIDDETGCVVLFQVTLDFLLQ